MKAGELVIYGEGMILNGVFYSPIDVPRGTDFLVRAFGITIGKAITAECEWDSTADEYKVKIAIEIKDIP